MVQRLGRTPVARELRLLRPQISVIVPVYNVELFVEECIASLAAQEAASIEFVIVDDGSTDASMDIVRRAVRGDRRFRIVTQANQGLGAARNTGMRKARGKYIGFVDSDDVIPPGAYRVLLESLHRTGSDFAVGNIARLRLGRTTVPAWARELHGRDQLAVTIDEVPAALFDVFACNKLFARRFLRSIDFRFPVGVHYEDQVPSVRSYLAARSFDILAEVTYLWRQRETGDSITQRTHELANLLDRRRVTHEVWRALKEHHNDALVTDWLDRRIVGSDVTPYATVVATTAGDEYVSVFRDWIHLLLDDCDWASLEIAGPRKRLLAWVCVHGTLDDIRDLVAFQRRNPRGFPVELAADGTWRDATPIRPELAAQEPPGLRTLRDADHVLTQLLTRADVETSDGQALLSIDGQATITGTVPQPGCVTAWWQDEAGTRYELEVEHRDRDDDKADASNPWVDARAGFFTARGTLPRPPADGRLRLTLWLRVEADGVTRQAPAADVEAGGGLWSTPTFGAGDARWVVERDAPFTITGTLPRFALLGAARDGDDLALDLAGKSIARVELRADDGTKHELEVRPAGPGRRHAVVPAALLVGEADYSIRVRPKAGRPEPVAWLVEGQRELSVGDRAVVVRSTIFGNARLLVAGSPIVDSPVVVDGVLQVPLLGGVEPAAPRLVARTGKVVEGAVATSADGSRFLAFALDDGSGNALVPAGTYTLETSPDDGAPPILPAGHVHRLPVTVRSDSTVVTLTRRRNGALDLRVQPPRTLEERDAHGQLQLRLAYERGELDGAPYSDTALFESFYGASATCNPRAIANRMASDDGTHPVVWSVNDLSVKVGPGQRRVVRYTRAWYEHLASARYLVNNTNFPWFFTKRPSQYYLQTWHGTPLKRIGHDILEVTFGGGDYLERMDREAATWDALISPNGYSSDIFPRAFAFDGPLLEIGYPRNDVVARDPRHRRAETLAALGIDPAKTVVLYAPTWRDITYKSSTGAAVTEYLDPEVFAAALGETHHLVLRGHSNTAARERVVDVPGVTDATDYPEVAELYGAADVLVTDYSSVMFDFAVTRKPIVYLVPDLEQYRDRYRGFYFDLEHDAPGPLTRTTEDLVAWLAEPSRLEEYEPARERFRTTFCSMEDGHATERALAHMLSAPVGAHREGS